MAEDTRYTLVPSSAVGRYALDWAEGRDITGGQPLAIQLGGQWIEGRVEHRRECYPTTGIQYLVNEQLPRVLDGFYFIANDGGVCGLCVGMKVKLL